MTRRKTELRSFSLASWESLWSLSGVLDLIDDFISPVFILVLIGVINTGIYSLHTVQSVSSHIAP